MFRGTTERRIKIGYTMMTEQAGPRQLVEDMLAEAAEIIRRLFDGGYVTHHGEHFRVEAAKLWDRPDIPPPIGRALSGRRSCDLAGRLADVMIAV
jgi:alkanesulfonate monooxygenase SsuD/methylene tetrahydromethanopterin reductase-like flavin-dependent oxidoreductase (luciferase family)